MLAQEDVLFPFCINNTFPRSLFERWYMMGGIVLRWCWYAGEDIGVVVLDAERGVDVIGANLCATGQ